MDKFQKIFTAIGMFRKIFIIIGISLALFGVGWIITSVFLEATSIPKVAVEHQVFSGNIIPTLVQHNYSFGYDIQEITMPNCPSSGSDFLGQTLYYRGNVTVLMGEWYHVEGVGFWIGSLTEGKQTLELW